MTIEEYIASLKDDHQITINVSGDKLGIKSSKKHIEDQIKDGIRARKEEILEYFHALKTLQTTIPSAPIQTDYPLSHAQRRLWILDQIIDVPGIYNTQVVHPLETLEIDVFKKAMSSLLLRHEILRTTISMVEGEPRQFVNDLSDFDFEVFHKKLETSDEAEIGEMIKAERNYRFDLSVSPIRATLLEMPDSSFIIVCVLHHIASDDGSMDVLFRDLSGFYQHYLKGSYLNLPDLYIQYKDYSSWQHNQLKSGNLDDSLKYWLETLSGEITELTLPLDRKRGTMKNYSGASVSFETSPEFAEQLSFLGRTHNVSLFMVLVGMVKVLLHRYTGQEDIIIGTPVTGRENAALKDQIGFYSNTIVLRSQIEGEDSFDQVLHKVRDVMLKGYKHQNFPFDLLVDKLESNRDISRNPLFDVMISFSNFLENNEVSHDWKTNDEITAQDDGANKFDLTFSFIQKSGGSLQGVINYDKSLFNKDKMIRMAKHLKQIMKLLFENSQQKISHIDYLSSQEKDCLINTFNDTYQNIDLTKSIKGLIEQQALKSPDEICLISEDASLTFTQVNTSANRLANYLIEEFDVRHGDHVGLIMSSSIERMIALYAVIKSGAAYVPVDADYPGERKQFIIEDTRMKVILSEENNENNYTPPSIHLTKTFLESLTSSAENPKVDVAADDTFTVLYTSGSTGKPKGVLLTNKGLVNRMQWLWDKYNFNSADVIYQRTPFVFDVSMGELFMPICFGAKILLVKGNSSEEMMNNMIKYNVTYMHFSPTMLNKFLETVDDKQIEQLTTLKHVFTSGEALLRETVSRYYKKFNTQIINLYGPTEASIEVSGYETQPGDDVIPIGKPIANVKLYILDKNVALVPIGVYGEIGIGGACLARGYLNQVEMTEQKFIHDPFCDQADARIYKTGDIGYWNDKGEIEFVGRRDSQLSINGSRIEIGEIESAILEHPRVRDVAITVKTDKFDNYHLVAHYAQKKLEDLSQARKSESQKPVLPVAFNEQYCLNGDLDHSSISEIDTCIHNLFEQSAIKHSSKVALICENVEISYKSLDEQSDRLAALLKTNYNLNREDLIAVLMEKSEKVIISMLAILKTGAAYIPIDPDYPDSRVATIIDDSHAKLIIVDQSNKQREITNISSSLLYPEDKELLKHSSAKMTVSSQSTDLCYACYTSGSTGKPKGVMIEHRSVVDYVQTFIGYFDITENDTVLQQSSISFDTAVEEIFPILCSGGKLVILPKGGRDVEGMINTINERSATILSTTPLVINELNRLVEDIDLLPRIVISGGDTLRPSYVDKLIDKTALYNTYGPTEATVCASFAHITNTNECNVIGRPIKHHRVYILDQSLKQVDHGTSGEICIAGPGLARGYLNLMEESNKKFIDNPFEEGILYRTGDEGRWNDEGFLEFIGRNDSQVKVKGYRVEPGEIDHAIQQHNEITSSHTMAKPDVFGQNHLITYYTVRNNLDMSELRAYVTQQLPNFMVPDFFVEIDKLPLTINGKIDLEKLLTPVALFADSAFNIELKKFLKEKLPGYMVPSHFRNMEKLPLTVTGKIDRKRLEKIDASFDEKTTHVPPRSTTEKKVVEIWQHYLNRTDIGIEDNFFEVGGNSLKGTQILSSIYRELESNVLLRDIYNNPNIRELAQYIDGQLQDKSLLIKLGKIEQDQLSIFFIPPIIGSSTIFTELAGKMNANINVYGLQYKGFDYEDSFDHTIAEMAKRFVAQIKRVQKGRVIPILGYSMGVPIAFEMAKMLEAEGKTVILFLVDRGTGGDTADMDDVLDKSAIDAILEKELDYWFHEIQNNDQERIKNLVFNNIKILNNYKVNGKVKSKIVAIESQANQSEAGMKNWQKYTSGEFEQFYINADHYSIMSGDNLVTLSNLITEGVNYQTEKNW